MRLPKGVEWSAHALVVLARLKATQPVPSAVLAEVFDLSAPYLNKHLQKLAAYGLLISTSGPSGGFALARSPEEITLANVVDAIEGHSPIFWCAEIRCQGLFRDCAAEIKASGPCRISAAMHQAEDAWRSSLSEVSIAKLAAGIDDDSGQRVCAFVQQKRAGSDQRP